MTDARGRSFGWPVPKDAQPFVLDAAQGLVLALRPSGGGPVFPLDAGLTFVDLTAEERGRVLAARHG